MTRHILRVPMGTPRPAFIATICGSLPGQERPAGHRRPHASLARGRGGSIELLSLEAKPGPQSGQPRSLYPYIPKIATALTLIDQILRRDEQVIVFSAFHGPLDILSRVLVELNCFTPFWNS